MNLNKVNKIIILFIFFIAAISFGVWQLIQTREFSRFVIGRFMVNLEKRTGMEIEFDHMELQLFPLATILKDVKIKSRKGPSGISTSFDFHSMGFYFSILDLLSNKLILETMKMDDGRIKIHMPENKRGEDFFGLFKSSYKGPDQKFEMKKYFNLSRKALTGFFPIKLEKIRMNKMDFALNNYHIWVNNLQLDIARRNIIKVGASFEDLAIPVSGRKVKGPVIVDMVKVEGTFGKDKISIDRMLVKSRLETLVFQGEIFEKDRLPRIKAKSNYKGGINELLNILGHKNIPTVEGFLDVDLKLSGTLRFPRIDYKGSVVDVRSEYLTAKKVDFEGALDDQKLRLSLFEIKDNGSRLNLLEPLEIFDFKHGRPTVRKLSIFTVKMNVKKLLGARARSWHLPQGSLSGRLDIEINKGDPVTIRINEGLLVENFKLLSSDGGFEILKNPKIEIRRGEVNVFDGNEVNVELDFSFGTDKSRILSSGVITGQNIDIKNHLEKISLKEFGPISGTWLEGEGDLKLRVSGPYDDVKLHFKDVNIDDFSVVDLNLGSVKTELRYDLRDYDLHILKFSGVMNATSYSGKGILAFGDRPGVDLHLSFPFAYYRDTVKILDSFFTPPSFLPKDFSFTYNSDFKIKARSFDFKDMMIFGNLNVDNVKMFHETLDTINAKFSFGQGELNVSDIRIRKGAGKLDGRFKYLFDKDHLNYSLEMNRMALNDFYLHQIISPGYNSLCSGRFSGNGVLSDLETNNMLYFHGSTVGNLAVKDSVLHLQSYRKDFYIKGNFLGNQILFDSYLNFDREKKDKKSYFTADVSTKELNLFTGLFLRHNIVDREIEGKIAGHMDASFSVFELDKLSLNIFMEDFYFKRKKLKLSLVPDKNRILVVNGKIENWDMVLSEGNNRLTSNGEGVFYGRSKVENNFRIDPSSLEMIFPGLRYSKGVLEGRLVYFTNKNDFSLYFESQGDDLDFRFRNVPGNFEKVSYKTVWEGKDLLVQKLEGKYGGGTFGISGGITFGLSLPIFDLSLKFDKTQISLLKRSSFLVSGTGELTGSEFPYSLKGDISVLHGEILDKFQDFFKGHRKVVVHDQFLPKRAERDRVEYLELDVNTRILRPVLVRNSLMSFQLRGNGNLGGTNLTPLVDGNIKLLKDVSKIRFKGHDFIVSEGGIILSNRDKKNYFDYNLLGQTTIGEYKINLNVVGHEDNISLNLSSLPVLTREDILSLMALGITSDVSKGLSDSERQSITSIGLGNILVDQLELGKNLDKTLGMKLSITPEFSEERTSYLSARGATADSDAVNVRSATKIKLQKNIAKKVNLAVSSTVGGSIGQKQEMGIEYNLFKFLSLQGIYEVKSSTGEEAAPSQSSKSAGFDFIFRRSFK